MQDDLYAVLGVPFNATGTDIRVAYKKLAMQYHPDRNPGDAEAEEKFKQINNAYHVLSDPLKKSRYDSARFGKPADATEAYIREQQRKKYYRWQRAQQKRYVLDKNYFRIQGLAVLVFIVMAGFCFAVIHTANYVHEQKQLKHYMANTASLQEVGRLFQREHFDEAFGLVQQLQQQDPLEFRFITIHDSLVHALRHLADQAYDGQQYSQAVAYYRALQQHEDPIQPETLLRTAWCQYYLGNYPEAVSMLNQLHHGNPRNLEVVYWLATIHRDKLDQPEIALQYLDHAQKVFRINMSEIYGEAFMLVMNAADTPDLYYDIFRDRTRLNLQLHHVEAAVRDSEWAVFLRPAWGEPYLLRAQAKLQAGDRVRLCQDLQEAHIRQVADALPLIRRYCR